MSLKFKNIVSYILLLAILVTIVPVHIHAAMPTASELKGIKDLRTAEGLSYIKDDIVETEAIKIKSDGKVLVTNTTVSGKYKYFNIGVYKEYDIIVYGERHGSKDAFKESRYLGWDENGNEITNDRFQNDADSNTDLTKKSWIPADGNKDTWEEFAPFQEQQTQILTKKPIKNDGNDINLSIYEILDSRTNDSNIKEYIQVMVGPRLTSYGTVKLQHKTSTKTWYDSFTIPKLNYNFTAPVCTVEPKQPTYTLKATDMSVTISLDVKGDVSMSPPLGKTPVQIIQISPSKSGMIRLSYEGAKQDALISGSTAKATYNKTFSRGELQVGTNIVPLTGYVDYAESIYGDKWSGIAGNNTVTIIVEPTSTPFVAVTATPVPDSVKFADADIPVKVNINAALQGYYNISNINNVVIYAKFTDDPPSVFKTNTLGADTTVSTSFDFTIPKSKITEDNFDQQFSVTAVFNYKTAVNGATNTIGSTSCITNVYKEEPIPPVPGNIPPKAKIKAPSEVKAGDEFLVDGSFSSDEDGYIADYEWNLPGTDIELYGESGDVWYPEEGKYNIRLRVGDDGGAHNSTSKSIVVLPPTPDANIKILGTLKENRKITIDASGSTSPTHYPMVWANTVWGLSPVSGNTSSDIKYSGVLNGIKTKDVLVKKSGTDRVSLSVANIKGLSDTESTNIIIAQDKPPIADFSTVTSLFRNPEDTNYSLITISDTSYSIDNDYIKNCILTFSYDSDNNGTFNNGNIQIDAATYANGQTKLVTTPWGFDVPVTVYKPANKPIQIDIRTKHVGKYYADLKAIEGFGQETIADFITEADYRFDDTLDKPNIEKTIEVLNLAPVGGFNMTNKRNADIVIALPDNITKASVESQVNSKVVPGLVNNNMDYNIRYVNYQTHLPLPVDNYAYFVDADHGNHETNLFQYNYSTGDLIDKRMTHLSGRYAEPFVTSQNIIWCKSESSYYEGDGKSVGYYRLMKYDGNNGLAATAVFTTLDEDGEDMGGDFVNITVNKEGSIFWTWTDNNKRYGCSITGQPFIVPNGSTMDQGLPYSSWSDTSPTGCFISAGKASVNNKPHFRVFSTTNGVGTMIAEFRRSLQDDGDEDEWVRIGRYYPPDDLYTIDEAFNNVAWADNYEKYFVTLSNRNIMELNNSYIRNKITTNSIINDVTLFNMGNATNKGQFDTLIEKNDGKGLYTDVTSLSTAFTKLSDYILNRINIDLVFNVGQSAYSLGTIRAKVISIMKPILAAGNVSANISYISTAVDMNSALSSSLWSPLNDHMFIHVQDTLITELNDSTKKASILQLLKENEADLIGLGRSANLSQINNLVSLNDSEGTYIDNTVIDTAISNLGNYIVDNAMRTTPSIYKYVVLGEEIDYNTTYKDIENDSMHSERWKYIHNESFFDNNLGKISDSGVYRAAPYTVFTKTGKYEITYGVRDNPKNDNLFDYYRLWSNEELSKATLFVHRKPIASYLWNITKTSGIYDVSITDTSEDQDHLSRADKGIAQRQWKWKLPNDIGWQQGIPTNLQVGNTYILQLLVQDIEGAWSEPYIQEIEISSLIIEAIPSYRDWSNTDVNVNVITTRTGAAALTKVEYKWTNSTDKPTSGWLTNNTYSFYTAQVNNGEWYLHLVAYDNRSETVYVYKGPYRIDKIPPVITADKSSVEESNEPVEVNVNVTDAGGSGIKDIKYAWSQAVTKPTAGWTIANGSFSTIQEEEGLWYLHVEATDNAGNVTYECFGTYMIETFKLEKFRIVMVRDLHLENYYYNSFTGKYDDRPMYVNSMAVDGISFGNMVDGLTKGYKFEFELDSRSFNDNTDTIIIEPHFFTTDGFARDEAERDLYWEDSKHQIFKVGEGGHREWKTITLDASNRTIKSDNEAIWRGEYLIPGSSWAVSKGTTKAQAKSRNLKRDIIVNFHIMGYKDGVLQFDYNAEQWELERTTNKYPYIIGDVIRYSWDKNCLDDIIAKDNR